MTSIADDPRALEFFTADEWNELLFGGQETLRSLVEIDDGINPALPRTGNLEIPFVWGFDKKSKAPSLMISNYPIEYCSEGMSGRQEEDQKKFLACWAPVLLDSRLERLTIEELVFRVTQAVNENNSRTLEPQFISEIGGYIQENYSGDWYDFDGMSFFFLKKEASGESIPKLGGPEYERDRRIAEADYITKLYDTAILRNRVKRNIPWRRISELSTVNLERYYEIFFSPLQFTPSSQLGERRGFLWPWQRCMMVGEESKNRVSLQNISTTSVVGDLRFSTAAMGAFEPAEAYSELLDELQKIAHEIILEHGAYFDKETGDGFVAHFCRSTFDRSDEGDDAIFAEVNSAISLASKLIITCNALCERYQQYLKTGLDGLKLSVGVHFEDAVWISDRRQVRAIGPSVVWASRLCSAAEPGELLVSNKIHELLTNRGNKSRQNGFLKKPINIKEFNPKSKPYAFGKSFGGQNECV